jgi:hypothetical protein
MRKVLHSKPERTKALQNTLSHPQSIPRKGAEHEDCIAWGKWQDWSAYYPGGTGSLLRENLDTLEVTGIEVNGVNVVMHV